MQNGKNLPTRGQLRFPALTLVTFLCCVPAAQAQPAGDPVEALRQVLKTGGHDLEARAGRLQEAVAALHSLGDLRRALVLQDWRDEDIDPKVAAVDRSNRAALAKRFEENVRGVLRRGNTASRLAALKLLAELGVTARDVGTKKGYASKFGPDLAVLIKQGDPGLCEAAAHTLAQINPDPRVAVEALSGLLHATAPAQRRAAAMALADLARSTAQFAARKSNWVATEVTRGEMVKMSCAFVALAGNGLRDDDAQVRRRSVEAIDQAAQALCRLISDFVISGEIEEETGDRQKFAEEQAELLPLILVLKEQVPQLTRALSDGDAEVRLLARRALEDITNPQLRLIEKRTGVAGERPLPSPGGLRPSHFLVAAAPSEDPLLHSMQGTAQALAAALTDSDPRGKRAAIDVLETLGPAAAPAAAALVGALNDTDSFVRWSAARTLGKISPVEADSAVPGLARLLSDLDLDIRLASATALERYGPAAKDAIPDLVKATRSSDAVMRVATIHALGAVAGPEPHAAVPPLIKALSDSDASVRQTAAEVLGKFGPAASDAVDELRKALKDNNSDVQQAAGDALLNITEPVRK
jgi:HEAT repeat protein